MHSANTKALSPGAGAFPLACADQPGERSHNGSYALQHAQLPRCSFQHAQLPRFLRPSFAIGPVVLLPVELHGGGTMPRPAQRERPSQASLPSPHSTLLLSLPPLPSPSPFNLSRVLPLLPPFPPRAICWLCVCHGVGGLITQGQVGKWREAGDTHISYSVQRPGPKALGREMHGIQRLDGGEGE